MKRVNRATLTIALMTAFTFMAFASTVTGTLAWYAYSTRAILSFTGVAVRQSVQLEIGVVDDLNYYSSSEIANYNLERVSEDGHSIVWNKSSSGLTSDMILAYLNDSPYAKSELSPVSTLGRSGDDALSLYEAPETGDKHGINRNYSAAETKTYVRLPFAFRVLNSVDESVSGQSIWITDAVAASTHSIEQSIRLYVDNNNDSGAERFLFRPASTTLENPGQTVVAGMLDLDNNGYYDFNPETKKEYLYGDISYVGEMTYDSAIVSSTGFVDENDTGDTSQDVEDKTTFYSRHLEGTMRPNINKATYYRTAAYETKKSIYPYIDATGNYAGGKPIAITPNNSAKIAYCTLTIFIEGWDHSVIDQAVGEAFYLGLTFEINKVQDE